MNDAPGAPPRNENGPYAVFPAFVSETTCQQLASLTDELFERQVLTRNVFQLNTWNATIDRISLRPCADDPRWELCQQILDEIMRSVVRVERIPDPVYGDFLSYMTPGGLVRPHRDDWKMDVFAEKWAEPCQVRCNVFLQKQPGSGDPLIAEGEGATQRLIPLNQIATGDLLVFSPTWSIHAANRVHDRPRIMASYSFLMSKQDFVETVQQVRARPAARNS